MTTHGSLRALRALGRRAAIVSHKLQTVALAVSLSSSVRLMLTQLNAGVHLCVVSYELSEVPQKLEEASWPPAEAALPAGPRVSAYLLAALLLPSFPWCLCLRRCGFSGTAGFSHLLTNASRTGAAANRSSPSSKERLLRGAGGLRGATPRSRSERAAVRRYPSSKVRSRGCALLEQP